MSPPVRFRLLEDGRWSGGGSVLLANAREAREVHPILRGGPDAIPIMARNVAPMGRFPRGRFVAAPQNAWVWTPVAKGVKERTLVTGLRVGTEVTYRFASAIVRISEAIPPSRSGPTSHILHNVLDSGFEVALARHDDMTGDLCEGAFVCVGSNYSFRDLARLVRAHARYRSLGGDRRLVLMGPVGSRVAEDELQRAIQGANTVVRHRTATRAECLTAMRVAHGVVSPALVEASPIGVLEAAALSSRVLLSDIVGHRGMVRGLGGSGSPAYFRAGSETALAEGLATLDSAPAHAWAPGIDTPEARRAARAAWCASLAGFLTEIAETGNFDGDREVA